jgi:hypothetical protein
MRIRSATRRTNERFRDMAASKNPVGMVALDAVIAELRAQLETAMAATPDADLVFGLGDVEVELEVGVKATDDVETGIQLYVFTLGGQLTDEVSSVQRIKLVLTPQSRHHPERDVYVSDRGPLEPS